MGEPSAYLVEHIKEALLRDPEIGELDVQVSVDGERIVVTGHVATAERCEAIDRVLRQLLPGRDVRNETTVAVYTEPQDVADR